MSFVALTQAQDITFKYNGQTLNNGDTVSLTVYGDDEVKVAPTLYNAGTERRVVRIHVATQNETNIVPASVCAAGLCVSGSVSTHFAMAPHATVSDAYIDFMVPEQPTDGLFMVSVKDTLDGTSYGEVYVKIVIISEIDESQLAENTLRLYPNPASEMVNIECPNAVRVAIYDMNGKKQGEAAVNGGAAQLHVGSLKSGVYMVGIFDNEGNMNVRKVVKR